ncbi:MAG: sensor histidine kinase [Azospira oryzae]|nr:MAG: sensor histidine kinase [Azospira oryzae]
MQIRSRLTLQFTLLVGTIVLLSFFLVYYFTKQLIEQDFDNRLRDKAVTSAILLLKVDRLDSALLKVIDRAKRDNLPGENITVYDDLNREIYTNNDTTHFDISSTLINQVRQEGMYYFKQREYDIVGFLYKDLSHNYVIIAGAINLQGKVRLADLRTLLLTLFILMLLLVALTGWFYSGRALRPIQKVMMEADAISPIDLSKRLHESKHPDEIGKLITIFNKMLTRIESAFRHQKTFVANVSHELKNPLTKITSQLEVTLLSERPKEEYRATIESVLEDIKELNQLSVSLLDLARVEREENSFTMTRVRLDEVLWEVRETVESFDADYKVNFEIEDMPEEESRLYINGNLHLLKTALQNVIENACKFSFDKKAVVILSCPSDAVQVSVLDQGPGIARKDIVNVFQPFYRADGASKIKGYGIGLSLSQRIISIHKGSVEVESEPGKGTRVILRFPVAAEE